MIMTMFLSSMDSAQYFAPGACRPDGSFNALGYSYNEWAFSGFFQITLGFGALSFTKVKAFSIIWDMVSSTKSTQTISPLKLTCITDHWTGRTGRDGHRFL